MVTGALTDFGATKSDTPIVEITPGIGAPTWLSSPGSALRRIAAPPAPPKATKAAQPKKAAPPAKDGTTKRKGFGYIGKRKEAKYEDVGDAKQRVAAKNAQSSHVGGAVVLDAAWCPEGWTVETFTRGPQDKSAGTTYNVWHAPDGAKYRSKKSVERRVAADAARERLIASGGGDPAALEALAALDSGDAATRAMEAKTRYVPVSTDPAVLALAGAFFRDGVCCLDAPYLDAAAVEGETTDEAADAPQETAAPAAAAAWVGPRPARRAGSRPAARWSAATPAGRSRRGPRTRPGRRRDRR